MSQQQENGIALTERNRMSRRATNNSTRFSQMTDEYRSPPQSPRWSAATSFDATSEMSIYQSALDLDDSKVSSLKSDSFNQDLKRSRSSCPMADEPDVIVQTEVTFEGQPTSSRGDIYFRDGVRLIDFVLAYKIGDVEDDSKFELRRTFEDNLVKEGLHLEYDFEEGRKVNFVKIHAPWEVLITYAEIMKFKMPMKELYEEAEDDLNSERPSGTSALPKQETLFEKCFKPFSLDPTVFPRRAKVLSKEFSKDKMFLFNIPDNKDQFFSRSNRSRVVDFILKRKRYTTDPHSIFAFGITRLLSTSVYTGAYPLHERNVEDKNVDDQWTKLTQEWASFSKLYKCQPLDYIKEYFGVKIGLYFAWLGFYTSMLIPASIVGLICFIYGIVTMYTNVPSNDICNKTLNIVMCPSCDNCQYWRLDSSCKHVRFLHLVDNNAMVFFALFMSIWGAVFLELWKRYSAKITYYWDLTGYDQSEEHPRPEYLARLSNINRRTKKNPITNNAEPYISFWKSKLPAIVMSISVVLLLVSIAIAAVIGVIFYRMSMNAALMLQYGEDDQIVTISASVVTTATAALINLVCIMLLNMLYSKVASVLTDMEMPRTQTEYDNSLTLKMFLLQFVNYYASIFYIAFFKGKIIGYPGKYERILGYRQEECGPGGCLMELSIQLAIIMVGKQALNAVMEMILPKLVLKYGACRNEAQDDDKTPPSNWERDYFLNDFGSQGLFSEYLEMVLQFGFVTIFVAAFPLAPLFALINNALEMRLDAHKFLCLFRRPVAQRIQDIGVWYRIMDCIGKLSVVTNAFIIAFTSTFIPRLVYRYRVSPDQTLNGYLNFSLSYFDVNDFESSVLPKSSTISPNISYCRYDDYRNDPSGEDKYEHTTYFWYLLVVRLAFVVVFENVVMLLITFLRWLVPDVPMKIREKIRKDTYLHNEILVNFELRRSQMSISNRRPVRKRAGADGDSS